MPYALLCSGTLPEDASQQASTRTVLVDGVTLVLSSLVQEGGHKITRCLCSRGGQHQAVFRSRNADCSTGFARPNIAIIVKGLYLLQANAESSVARPSPVTKWNDLYDPAMLSRPYRPNTL